MAKPKKKPAKRSTKAAKRFTKAAKKKLEAGVSKLAQTLTPALAQQKLLSLPPELLLKFANLSNAEFAEFSEWLKRTKPPSPTIAWNVQPRRPFQTYP